MKLTAVILVAAANVALAKHQHHQARHQHHHHHHAHPVKRAPDSVNAVYLPGPTVAVYELDGSVIPEDEVIEGLKNGTLRLADGGDLQSVLSTSADPALFAEGQQSSSSSSSSSAASSSAPAPVAAQLTSPNGGLNTPYDNSLDCTEFPSAFGAQSVDYFNLGGWIGIQQPGYSGSNGYNSINTATGSSCDGSKGLCCTEGSFCSYSCPPGYLKSQWPSLQGVTGQSVGGLQCLNGKLTLTRASVPQLCIPGASEVTIDAKNTLGQGVAVCRTDYPGTESETVPLWVAPGQTEELACPDGATYYQKNGSPTSAQYYVNPAGVSQQQGCTWGDPSNPWGNYAPLNLGVGYSGGKGWISIFQNSPTTKAKLGFNVQIQGDDISANCMYSASKQQYCSGSNYEDCNDQGCTVAVNSGTAYFVFS